MTLTEYIKQDLKSHISKEGQPPCKLTLSGLAGHYNVSTSPVRAAVDELISESYLRKQSNGRLVVNDALVADNHRTPPLVSPLPQ